MQPFDCTFFDELVTCMYTGQEPMRSEAQKVIGEFQDHPEAYKSVTVILDTSNSIYSKFIGLTFLSNFVKTRWILLPQDQKEGLKNFLITHCMKISNDETTYRPQKLLAEKMNEALVQVIKREWPHNWSNFIPEIVSSAKTSETICENNMHILQLLSEEIFTFSAGQMTASKIKELKMSFNKDFSQVFELCQFVLTNSTNANLVNATLSTLLRFLNWIPLGYVFQTDLVPNLVNKYFANENFRMAALDCLIEIANLALEDAYKEQFKGLFTSFVQQVTQIILPQTDLNEIFTNGFVGKIDDDTRHFIMNVANFFVSFYKTKLSLAESPEIESSNLAALNLMVNISKISEEEPFKVCIELWSVISSDLYNAAPVLPKPTLLLGSFNQAPQAPSRKNLYSSILSQVREILIFRMAKPEEVLIVENDVGEIVREMQKDTEVLEMYKRMREVLVFLTHLDYQDTERIMLDKLAKQVDGSEWSWYNINTLCWAVGSIAGCHTEEAEKNFLVVIITDLIMLTEKKSGKANRAVVASNIMYIVGQYPRFLRNHWRFLRTVTRKLFEFMHESHPGVQDMVVDTFLKIATKCKKKYATTQQDEGRPFVEDIIEELGQHTSDLEDHQVCTFFEALAVIVEAVPDANDRSAIAAKLFATPNEQWAQVMALVSQNVDQLLNADVCSKVSFILKVNYRACKSLGHLYMTQLGVMYLDMLNVYQCYSNAVSKAVAADPNCVSRSDVRAMRTAKQDTLILISEFISKSEDSAVILSSFIPPALESILNDYRNNAPAARDPQVLHFIATVVSKLKSVVATDVPSMFAAVFEPTLSMVTQNYSDFPEIRKKFYLLLQAIARDCFQALLNLPPNIFKLVNDSVIFGMKHTDRDISELALNTAISLFHFVAHHPEASQEFYSHFLVPYLDDTLFVLTDSLHKSGFRLQAHILSTVMSLVESGSITVPLWDKAGQPYPDNSTFLKSHVTSILSQGFAHVAPQQIQHFAEGLVSLSRDLPAFKAHLRDFLVNIKEFSVTNNEDLYRDERDAAEAKELEDKAAVPGLLPQE